MATRDIAADEVILAVPSWLIIDSHRIRSMMQRRLHPKQAHLSPIQWLMAFLVLEMNRKYSNWQPYFNTLPTDFDHMPIVSLTDSECELLPMHIQDDMRTQRYRMTADRKALNGFVSEALLDRSFVYAWCCVNSRCVYLSKVPGDGRNVALVPFFDLLNHSNETQTMPVYDTQSRTLIVKAAEAVSKGQEVYINYGPHDGAFLLMEYGFFQATPYDFVPMDEDVKHWCIEHGYLSKWKGLEKEHMHVDLVVQKECISWCLWRAALALMEQDEEAAMRMILAICAGKLKKYDASMVQWDGCSVYLVLLKTERHLLKSICEAENPESLI